MTRWAIRLVGPLLLVAVVLRIEDPARVLRAIAACDGWWLGGAVLLNLVNIQLKVTRWRLLLAHRGIDYPRRLAWLSFLSSSYLALLTPGRLGDALRVRHLHRDAGVPYSEGFAALVVDRLCDVYVLAAFAAVAVVRHAPAMGGELTLLLAGGLAAVVLGPPLVLLVPGLAQRVGGTAYRRLTGDRAGQGIRRFVQAVTAAMGPPLLRAALYTVATFVLTYVQGAMIAQAMGVALPFADVVCAMAIASLLALLPISVSGVGPREAYFALLFPWLGLTAGQGVAFGLLVFAVVHAAITLLGFVAWQISPRKENAP